MSRNHSTEDATRRRARLRGPEVLGRLSTTTPPSSILTTILENHISIMASNDNVRVASHAGSWYTSTQSQLSSQLDGWLAAVKPPVKCIGPASEGQTEPVLPVPGARMIIAPYVMCEGSNRS